MSKNTFQLSLLALLGLAAIGIWWQRMAPQEAPTQTSPATQTPDNSEISAADPELIALIQGDQTNFGDELTRLVEPGQRKDLIRVFELVLEHGEVDPKFRTTA